MRILHTMLRVGDLDKSIDFYVNRLGMSLLRKKEYPHGKFTLAFVGYGSEKENAVIELTYNCGKKSTIAFTMHDSIILDMSQEDAIMLREIKDKFEQTRWGPFVSTCKIGTNFGELKEIKI